MPGAAPVRTALVALLGLYATLCIFDIVRVTSLPWRWRGHPCGVDDEVRQCGVGCAA